MNVFLYEATITLIPKPDKGATKKGSLFLIQHKLSYSD